MNRYLVILSFLLDKQYSLFIGRSIFRLDAYFYSIRVEKKLTIRSKNPNLLPSLGAVGLPRSIDSPLIFSQLHERDRQFGVVRNAVEQDFGSVVHAVVEASVADLKSKN